MSLASWSYLPSLLLAFTLCFSYAKIMNIKVNDKFIYPPILSQNGSGCPDTQIIQLKNGQSIRVVANQPFILILNSEPNEGMMESRYIVLKGMSFSSPKEQFHEATATINVKCQRDNYSFLEYKTLITAQFYSSHLEQTQQFKTLSLCVEQNQIQIFNRLYKPVYSAFWIFINLVLQHHHNFMRDRTHLGMFGIYLLASLTLEGKTSDLIQYFLFWLVVLRQRRQNRMNQRHFILYLIFSFMILLNLINQYFLTPQLIRGEQPWNIFQILISIHISMFMVTRLLKLSRLRYVVWYMLVIFGLVLVVKLQKNIFFELRFKSPLNFECFSVNIFLVIMSVPICNYFGSISNWAAKMNYILIPMLVIFSIEVQMEAIIMMVSLIFVIQLITKGTVVIRHRY